MKKVYKGLFTGLVSLLFASVAFAEVGGDLNLQNKASLVSRDGYNLNFGTEGDDDLVVIQNNARTLHIDGITKAVTVDGALTVTGGLTATTLNNPIVSGNLTFTTAAAKIIPGATSLTIRSTADAADNLSITDAGLVTVGTGNLAVTAGNLIFDSATASILGGATSLTVGSAASTIIKADNDTQRLFTFDASSDTALTQTFGDAGTTAVQKLTISASTADGDDDSTLILAGGGADGGTRGASITLPGEEVAGGGDIDYNSGASDVHRFKVNGTEIGSIGSNGMTVSLATSDFISEVSGGTLSLEEATAGTKCMGTLTCNGASDVTTSTTCAEASSRIFLTRTSLDADTSGDYYVKSISAGVSFTVACETNDTGTLNWIIFHET